MNILYFSWGETTKTSCILEMIKLGHDVFEFSSAFSKYDHDIELQSNLNTAITEKEHSGVRIDVVFSFNYFPDVSRVCEERKIKYVSWVYDSPHSTLQSKTLSNSCNKVFLFDYALYAKYQAEGIETVRYMPLPVRTFEYSFPTDERYDHDISFLGNLYDKDRDQFGLIKTFPEYIEGYTEAAIVAQEKIFGYDLISNVINEEVYKEISKYVNTELGDNYRKCGYDIFKNMMRKRVTMNERIRILKELGSRFTVDFYSESARPELPVNFMGYADYETQMPEIFYRSKININVTLRSIQTGIPLRVMDILGAGGFCITNYQPEIDEYFENGVDIVWYEDMDDLINKAAYYLEHDEEREAIALNGHNKAKELFSYDKQLAKIFGEM